MPVDYVRARNEVQPKVFEVVTEFWECNACRKIYWEGPKYDSAYDKMLEVFAKVKTTPTDGEGGGDDEDAEGGVATSDHKSRRPVVLDGSPSA